MDKITKVLNTDDLAWVSSKLINDWNSTKYIKDEHEKNSEVSALVWRALRFGLEELVSKFGYLIMEIPLPNKRVARLIIPNDITEGDIGIILHYLEMLTNDLNDERSVARDDAQGTERQWN